MGVLKRLFGRPAHRPDKGDHELAYWKGRLVEEGRLSNGHYEPAYTTHFGLTRDSYTGKRVLDVGCGPRGSLEWADMALERVGLDPLVERYKELGIEQHAMRYVGSPAETMPFESDHFDVVTSFNSLDHVDDLDRTIAEIVRVLRPGGLFLLATDLHEEPTECEPIVYSWEIVERFQPALELVEQRHYEKVPAGLYQSLAAGRAFDHDDPTERYGIVTAKFRKPARA